MVDLKIERFYSAPPERVFAYITEPENLIRWWGPEELQLAEHALDFRAPGPWFSVIVNARGNRYKMSGEVVSVSPPKSIELTWGWHDDQDQRGPQSYVQFKLAATEAGGTAFTLTHKGLADEEVAQSHQDGWTSTLVKLEQQLNLEK